MRKNIQIIFAHIVLLIALFFLYPSDSHAASQVVTNNNDSGAGSLRQAILDIESSGSDGDAITFNLSSGNETITISSQFALIWQKNFSIDGDNTAGSGTNVTIQVTTPGTSTFRIFEIRPYSGTYTFSNMTLLGGNVSSDYGGTIKVHSGDSTGNLTLENVTISGSSARYGGCIYAWGTMGTLTINNSTLSNCSAANASPYGGGALFGRSVSSISITSSSFNNNTSNYQGGGIYVFDELFSMDKVTIDGNSATNSGGGIYIDGDNTLGISTLTNSTVSNNSTGSIAGGIHAYYGKLRLTNTTVSNNSSTSIVGGIYSGYGTMYMVNTTVAENNSTPNAYDGVYTEGGSTLYVKNTILANNGTGNDITNNATVSDGGYNIVETSSGQTFNATGDIAGSQSNLNLSSTLALNSSSYGTKTLALSSGSVAIDAGNSTTYQSITIPSTDQRGISRSGTVDIGAYEFDNSPTSTPTPTTTPTPTNTPTPTTTPTPTLTSTPTPASTSANANTNTSTDTSTKQPQIAQQTILDAGGVFTPLNTSHTNGQDVVVITPPRTFIFDAFLSSVSSEPSLTGSLPNPITGEVQKNIPRNVVVAGDILGIKRQGTVLWQVGNIQNIWYKAYGHQYDSSTGAKIIGNLQKHPSIVSLKYSTADLIPPGRPSYSFNPRRLSLAHSADGISWRILSSSVVDTNNRTVAALDKIGGYYMIVGR